MMKLKNKVVVISALLFFILSLGMVYASDNSTGDFSDDLVIDSVDNSHQIISTHIDAENIDSYYKEKNQLVCYLKDDNGNPLENKNVIISLDGKTYNETTTADGEVNLDINLKPNAYKVAVNFEGDDDYNSSSADANVIIKKAPLAIKTNNYKTYVKSDLFFKAKVYNKLTKNPASGIKVLFKVYSIKTKRIAYYYGVTDENGIAALNKNLKVGSYIICTYIKDDNHILSKNSKSKASMTVLPTAEVGCCSFYVQVSGTDAVCGFRRDSTYSANIYIKNVKWYGRTALKQYKTTGQYFFHIIVTSDGWMVGTGGADSASINKAIEKLAGQMVQAGKLDKSKLNTIKRYISQLGIGHFAIKAPNGKYAAVWLNGMKSGKLKAGQYISVPNSISYFRAGNYAGFSKNPETATLKIGATDQFGLNRRDISIYHWTSTTSKSYKTTSSATVYAANDDGKYSGRSSKAYLKDDIYFKNQFISKNSLPYPLKMKLLGVHSFGSIDKLIKTPTVIKAPEVTNQFNTSQYFKVAIKNKNTKKAVSGIKVKFKFVSSNLTKYCTLKTDSNGMIRINTHNLPAGTYAVGIMPANNQYLISYKSKIVIVE